MKNLLTLAFFLTVSVCPIYQKTVLPIYAAQGWEQNWENTLAEAKKEAAVSVYAIWGPTVRIALTQAFKEKFGLNLEYTPFSRGAELLARAQGERTSGHYVADVFGAGGPTLVATVKPEGLLGPLEPLMILPEVTGPKSWSGGKFPYLDKDKLAIGMIASLQRYIVFNTNLIRKGEITAYKDLLKPQYKGKITLNDPTVTGVGNALIAHLALHLWNEEEARRFLRQLVREQEAVIVRDNRQHVEMVARGKYAIALAPQPEQVGEFLKVGAPLDAVILKEGTFVSPAAGALGVPKKAAHPNAAKVFINWLLSKEGQTVFSKSIGVPSLRSDVAPGAVPAMFVPEPDEKLFLDSEESILFRGKWLKIAKEVIETTQ